MASSLPAQTQLYSSYNGHMTLRGLAAMTADRAVCFISELFGGSISDQELVICRHFLDFMPSVGFGASIMTDKVFDIQHLLVPYGAIRCEAQHSSIQTSRCANVTAECAATQQTAKVRIHIE